MAGSHILEEHIFTFHRSDLHELLKVVAHMPRKDDSSRYYELDFLDSYHSWNKSPNAIDTVKSGPNTAGAHFANQEHQNYYDQQDQQYITPKYNSGLEQVTLELAIDIIIEEEEEDVFYQWANQYD